MRKTHYFAISWLTWKEPAAHYLTLVQCLRTTALVARNYKSACMPTACQFKFEIPGLDSKRTGPRVSTKKKSELKTYPTLENLKGFK
jgi:hypothetical protein